MVVIQREVVKREEGEIVEEDILVPMILRMMKMMLDLAIIKKLNFKKIIQPSKMPNTHHQGKRNQILSLHLAILIIRRK